MEAVKPTSPNLRFVRSVLADKKPDAIAQAEIEGRFFRLKFVSRVLSLQDETYPYAEVN